jgi:hypothetical protein
MFKILYLNNDDRDKNWSTLKEFELTFSFFLNKIDKKLLNQICRYYIEPNAREDNNIPVVNIHLSEPMMILPRSPFAGLFLTIMVYLATATEIMILLAMAFHTVAYIILLGAYVLLFFRNISTNKPQNLFQFDLV